MKLAENVFNKPADLWFGYTQNSFWQAGNQEASSPFRESNYQPEFMAVMPVDFNLLGMRARFVNLGLVHQSNGQASSLSRSWNRVYAQLGMENGDFTLLARVWQRLNEDAADDDNPDIVKFMGRGDIVGTYRRNGHEYSALARYNFDTHKGAAQLSWAFPIASSLHGYVQLFSGYGQSLIDYNHSMNVLGLGVMVSY
jgi:phospholipase A1